MSRNALEQRFALAWLTLFALALDCTPSKGEGYGDAARSASTAASLRAVVPFTPARFAPSQVEIAGGATIDGTWLSDVDECDGCHSDVVAMWRTSAHAFASFNNPVYRLSVDRYRAEVGNEKSRFCGGCHDVSLLVAGAMDAPIAPDDLRAHAGVTCKTCHSIEHTRPDGNGSYTLTSAPIPLPARDDPASLARHKERLTLSPLRSGIDLCASCHRAFLGEETGNARFFAGTDDVTPFLRSPFAGSHLARIDDPLPEKDCRGCHMPREAARLGDVSAKDGTIASHRFLGGHTWLAAMRGDREQLQRITELLRGAASIDIAVAIDATGGRALPADGAKVTPGERLVLDVVTRNLGTGHRFPGGTLDAQDTWIEVTVEDARGLRLFEHGVGHAGEDDPSAHRLRAFVVDEAGAPRLERDVNHFRTVVHNHTLPPRDAEVIAYALDVPASLPASALPLKVKARLRHRSRGLALQRAACADASTPRGRAFRGKTPLDPCPPQPIIDVAEAEAWIGAGAEARLRAVRAAVPASAKGAGPRPSWRRLLDHGYGMLHAVQERVGEARPSLERALALLGDEGQDHDRAAVLAALGALSTREGRTDEARGYLDRAALLAPGEPSIGSLRGAAFAEVWRFAEAVGPLGEALRAAPRDDGAAGRLALSLLSLGEDPRAALVAAQAGLGISPRDPDLLRVQSVALTALGAAPEEREAARAAYETYRPADDVPALRTACSKNVPGCALERIPVHEHVLRPVE